MPPNKDDAPTKAPYLSSAARKRKASTRPWSNSRIGHTTVSMERLAECGFVQGWHLCPFKSKEEFFHALLERPDEADFDFRAGSDEDLTFARAGRCYLDRLYATFSSHDVDLPAASGRKRGNSRAGTALAQRSCARAERAGADHHPPQHTPRRHSPRRLDRTLLPLALAPPQCCG